MERPPPLTFLGWLFVVLGVLALLGGIYAVVFFEVIVPPGERRLMGSPWLTLALQAILASAMLAGGKGLLAGHAWARHLLEGVCWLLLLGDFASLVDWLWIDHDPTHFVGPAAAAGVIAAAIIWVLRRLRAQEVRHAVGS